MGPPRSTILVLDYVGVRSEAPVTALGLEDAGYRVANLMDPPHIRALSAADYADQLLRRTRVAESDVAAVFAYCMAVPIAQEVAARLSTPEYPLTLVTFDGEAATCEAVNGQYQSARAKIAAMFGVRDGVADDPSLFDEVSLRERPHEVACEMYRSMMSVGTPGKETEIAANWFLDWVIQLIAAHNADWPAWPGDVLQVVSRTQPVLEPWPGHSGVLTTRRISADRQDLLREATTRATVLAYLHARLEES